MIDLYTFYKDFQTNEHTRGQSIFLVNYVTICRKVYNMIYLTSIYRQQNLLPQN